MPAEARIRNLPASERQVDPNHIAAERIQILLADRRRIQPPVKARIPVVIEQVFPVE